MYKIVYPSHHVEAVGPVFTTSPEVFNTVISTSWVVYNEPVVYTHEFKGIKWVSSGHQPHLICKQIPPPPCRFRSFNSTGREIAWHPGMYHLQSYTTPHSLTASYPSLCSAVCWNCKVSCEQSRISVEIYFKCIRVSESLNLISLCLFAHII